MVTEQQQVVVQSQPMEGQQYAQQQYPQQYQQQQVVIVKQQKPFFGLVENNTVMACIIIGVIFLLLGSIMVNIAPEITNKSYPSTYSGSQQLVNDTRTQKALGDYGNVFKSIGVFFIFTFLLLAAVLRTDLSDYTRFGILLLIGLIMFAARFTLP